MLEFSFRLHIFRQQTIDTNGYMNITLLNELYFISKNKLFFQSDDYITQ
jgi:hypothetical protein